jgi:Phosphoribosylanthranilate isomerase
MIRIKICGNKRVEDMHIAAKLGAHALGFIFNIPSSPRNNTFEEAKNLVANSPSLIDLIPVTTSENIHEVLKFGIRTIQTIGNIKEIFKLKKNYQELNLIPVLYVREELPDEGTLKICSEFKAIVIDTKSEKHLGGSGIVHDWNISRKISKELGNVILAGGLNEKNVVEAITKVEPYGVDVSSGVESRPGVKDPVKMRKFIEAVMKYR